MWRLQPPLKKKLTRFLSPISNRYQIRRSSSACNLLEAKWLIANHPLLQGEVDFEEVDEGPEGMSVCSPGLGEMIFENDFPVASE